MTVERPWMIRACGLTKRYGNLLAVDGLELAVAPGEIFGFLGPNGAGKTTTIRMLTGLLCPTAGRALIGGYDIQEEPLAAKALIGYVPDTPFLYEKLTGREFLRFIARLYDLEAKPAARRAEELLRFFDLQDRADDLIQSYSHGMRQKLALT
ncbi:MAG: ABC transporter ATP-binding protein, partial [Armatimonadota bacterium]